MTAAEGDEQRYGYLGQRYEFKSWSTTLVGSAAFISRSTISLDVIESALCRWHDNSEATVLATFSYGNGSSCTHNSVI